MIKFTVLGLSLGLFACLQVSAAGFQNTSVGATSKGMGEAFRATANDWTAAYYNPAGYAFIPDNQLGLNWAFPYLRHELTPNYGYRDNFGNRVETGVFNDHQVNNSHEILNIPSAGFLLRFPVWQETVFGLSAFEPFDYNISWNLYTPPEAYNDLVQLNGADTNRLDIPTSQFSNNLDVVAFQLTAAREFIPDKLSIGLGLQLLRGDLVFNDLTFRNNPLASPVSDRPRDLVPEFSSNDGRGWGFGINAGMMMKVTPKMNVAATVKIPFDIKISGESTLSFLMPRNTFLSPQYQPGSEEFLFTNGSLVPISANFETTLKLPTSLAAGIAYNVNEKLNVAFDVEYTLWSKYNGLEFEYADFSYPRISEYRAIDSTPEFFTSDLSSPVEWNNSGKIMAGLNYKLNNLLTIMAGASLDQSVAREGIAVKPQFVDTGNKLTVNLGGLFHLSRWDFGLVTSFTDFPDQTISGFIDLDNDGINDNFPGTYGARGFETIISVGHRF
ncbi:MAG: outer membrane protein transport protein [candidate division Zixibacteria bacterium]|nr:outer membrane protein transport protein [candidate division Zixibacteria bacterium]